MSFVLLLFSRWAAYFGEHSCGRLSRRSTEMRSRQGATDEKKAEPVVRANADICHDSCCAGDRASCRRGSPVTLGKNGRRASSRCREICGGDRSPSAYVVWCRFGRVWG